jgi:flagellar basal body-associated protein FliL
MSEEMKTIFWGRKKPSNIQGLGWGPEFWIYIMIYVIIMSLGAGIFHSHSAEQLEEQNNFIKALGSQQEFAVNPLKGKPSQRKTTV